MRTISLTAIRRLAIHAQGYAPRSRVGTPTEVEDAIRRLSCVQLDSITAVERSHRITLGSRVGAYPRETVSRLLEAGRIFEYWAHEACLIAVEEWPLFRLSMTRTHPWRGDVIAKHPQLAEEVLAAIRERGPLASRDFDGKGGGMWDWKPAKMVLEAFWHSGEIVIAGRVSGFQRLYDLTERVIPRDVLAAPAPDAETRDRELTLRAVRARGVLPLRGVAEHWRFRDAFDRPRSRHPFVARRHGRQHVDRSRRPGQPRCADRRTERHGQTARRSEVVSGIRRIRLTDHAQRRLAREVAHRRRDEVVDSLTE